MDGYYKESNYCKKCNSNCKTCENSNNCTSCNDHKFLINDTQECLNECNISYYKNQRKNVIDVILIVKLVKIQINVLHVMKICF